VVATLSLGWLLGWIAGPLLTGDDAALRMDYFKLLPIPARRLAHAMLGAAFANVSLVFSLIAYCVLRAQQRLQTKGPEIFARLRTSAS
jgi:ABC-2 type transport system permease protein